MPFGRVKKIMKTIDVALLELKRIADESEENSSNNHNKNNNDGNQIDDRRYRYTFMIANEVPYVMAKAAEMFIRDITTRAWYHTDQNRRKTIQRPDIIHATSSTEMYDFLIDVIPHATTECSHTNDTTTALSSDPVMYTEMPFFNQQPPLPPTLPPSGNDVVPTESPLPSDVTQQPLVLEQQQQQKEEGEAVTINDEFPTSYTAMSLPPNPLTTNMIFSPLTTTTTTNETQPNHHDRDHHLDTKTSMKDPNEQQQQQQHSTATPSYDDDDALSSHPQEWTLE